VLGPVFVHAALLEHPPLLVLHALIAVQVTPSPVYPLLHAHVFVPGPVLVHVALVPHPPLFVVHELIGVHVIPSPE
jgi:hypothetical protein